MPFENKSITELNELINAVDEAKDAACVSPAVAAKLEVVAAELYAFGNQKLASLQGTLRFYVFQAIKRTVNELAVQNTGLTTDELIDVVVSALPGLVVDRATVVGIVDGTITQ